MTTPNTPSPADAPAAGRTDQAGSITPERTAVHIVRAVGLGFGFAGGALFAQLNFEIHPGLTLIQGGDGRGKTSLLRIIAGQLRPQAGTLDRHAHTVFDGLALAATADMKATGNAWLTGLSASYPEWDFSVEAGLVKAFALQDHIDKPLFMLSTGSFRKLGLTAAAASGAQLTLIDCPFAALDTGSCRVLGELLSEAAESSERAWVMADYQAPPGMARQSLACLIDLGD